MVGLIMGKKKKKVETEIIETSFQETEEMRLERLEMAGAMMTQVIPDKKKYNRKQKYKEDYKDESY